MSDTVETINRDKNNIDQTRILPVVKDIGWLESIKQTVLAQGAETAPEYLYDVINTELVVMYAEDTPTNIRYLDAESVTELSIDITQLRELAITNLLSLLPPLERHGDQGLYMIAADGNYEASLLLHQDLHKLTGDNLLDIHRSQRPLTVRLPALNKPRLHCPGSFAPPSYPRRTYRYGPGGRTPGRP